MKDQFSKAFIVGNIFSVIGVIFGAVYFPNMWGFILSLIGFTCVGFFIGFSLNENISSDVSLNIEKIIYKFIGACGIIAGLISLYYFIKRPNLTDFSDTLIFGGVGVFTYNLNSSDFMQISMNHFDKDAVLMLFISLIFIIAGVSLYIQENDLIALIATIFATTCFIVILYINIKNL